MSVSPHEGGGTASGLIIPDNIPGDDLKPWKLEEVARTLRTAGTSALAEATAAEETWAKLPGVLESPQGPTIYAALGTPSESARTIESKFSKVSDALDDFAAAMRPIKTTFSQIKTDAVAFRATIRWDEKVWIAPSETQEYEFNGLATVSTTSYSTSYSTGSTLEDVLEYLKGRGESTRVSGGRVQILAHWTQSSTHIDKNNALMDRLADAYAKLQNAEADCANAINRQRNLCVADVEYIEAWQLKQSGENTVVLPWGSRVDEERNCGESFWWGAGNAGKEALEGIAAFAGYDAVTGKFSVETAFQARVGLLAALGSLVLMTFPPSWLLGQLGVPVFKDASELVTNMGKGLIAWDTWAENPSEAAGRVLVNVGTMFIPGAGEVAAAIKALSAGSRIVHLAGDAASLADNVVVGINRVNGLDTNFTNLVGDASSAATKMDDLVGVGVRMSDGDVLHVGDSAPPTSLLDDAGQDVVAPNATNHADVAPALSDSSPPAGTFATSASSGDRASGARIGPSDISARWDWADEIYPKIREMDDDVARISASSSNLEMPDGHILTQTDIAAIKEHVFATEHVLSEPGHPPQLGRFDPDPDQAEAWLRLADDSALDSDRLLLHHEYLELTYLREHPGATYREAHEAANLTANWEAIFRGDSSWQ